MNLDPSTTALILIDLQQSNLLRPLQPHPAETVLHNGLRLAGALRAKGGMVIYARVLVHELLSMEADQPFPKPSASRLALLSELSPLIVPGEGDAVIEKRQWGAFHGTPLDQLLRRRGIRTLVLGGIATNFGVESTARVAMDLGYGLIFVEDAMSSVEESMHRFSIEQIFPRIGRVRTTEQVVAATL